MQKVLWTLLLSTVAWADFPPEGARLLSTINQPVVLRWDTPGKNFLLTVSISGRTVYQGPVAGNTFELPVRSGQLVRWSVQAEADNNPNPPFRSFQYTQQNIFSFNGKDGQNPGLKNNKNPSLDGVDGGPGGNIEVRLDKTLDGPLLTLQSQKYLLLPGPPLTIEVRGGRGADGQPGRRGISGGNNYGYLDGGPGQPGGRGGNGGQGGTVNIFAPGFPLEQYFNCEIQGGQAGRGGPGGEGGLAGWSQQNGAHFVGRPGPPGQAGPDGSPGPQGRVFWRN